MVEKIKTNVGRLLLVLIMKTNFPIYFAKIELFFNFETKCTLSTSVFIFPNTSKILETTFYVFWTQTCRNLKSIKFVSFQVSRALITIIVNKFSNFFQNSC